MLALLVAASGCRSLLGIEEAEVGPLDAGTDAHDDAAADAVAVPDGSTCYGSLLSICPAGALPPAVVYAAVQLIDTDNPASCTLIVPNGLAESACVVSAVDFSVPPTGRVVVRGKRPLVWFTTGTITIQGALEYMGNPSASDLGCDTPNAAGSAGGPGGSFGSIGGVGGQGGPVPRPPIALTALRGGCRGGSSGTAAGGNPGGGILLIADRIFVTGRINASGTGGAGGTGVLVGTADGGGGGGSGGLIYLDATAIMLDTGSVLIANGGGGGGGGGANVGALSGSPGSNPDPNTPFTAAPGGVGGSNGGTGGSGATDVAAQAGMPTSASGGGGGGGAGYIRLRAATVSTAGAVSPASE